MTMLANSDLIQALGIIKEPQQRIAELEELLKRVSRQPEQGPVIDTLVAIGALARRVGSVKRDGLEDRFDQLVRQAKDLLSGSVLQATLSSIDLDDLREDLQSLTSTAEERQSFELLVERERLEAMARGARELGLEEARLRQGLEQIDQVGRAAISAVLFVNVQRRQVRADLDPEPGACWWWSLRVDCDRDGLSDLSAGLLEDQARQGIIDHIKGCQPCREELAHLQVVDRLLGPMHEDHLASSEIVAYAAGELDAEQRGKIHAHLKACSTCRELDLAARAGLEEAEKLDLDLKITEQARPILAPDLPLHQVATIPPPPQPQALAASDEREVPLPEDRTVLVEEAEGFRVVYYRMGGRARVGLFAEEMERLEVLSCALDGRNLQPKADEPDGIVFELGPASGVLGRTLVMRIKHKDKERGYSWTFVRE